MVKRSDDAQSREAFNAAAEPSREALAKALAAAQTEISRLRHAAEIHDSVARCVGAVMALQTVDEATATAAIMHLATHHRIPVPALARALLNLITGSDDPLDDGRAGTAAAQVLALQFTPPRWGSAQGPPPAINVRCERGHPART
jgi:hypothetical protein